MLYFLDASVHCAMLCYVMLRYAGWDFFVESTATEVGVMGYVNDQCREAIRKKLLSDCCECSEALGMHCALKQRGENALCTQTSKQSRSPLPIVEKNVPQNWVRWRALATYILQHGCAITHTKCYAMLCYVMLCYATVCYVTVGYELVWHVYVMLHYFTLCYALLC